MRTGKFILLILISSLLVVSCSKEKKEEEKKFTPLVGEWINLHGSEVDFLTVSGVGLVCVVDDDDINESTIDGGTLHVYVRQSLGKLKAYYHLPEEVPGYGELGPGDIGNKGYNFKSQMNPKIDVLITNFVRGIIIPKGETVPAGVNMDIYEEVAEYFDIKD